MLALLSSYLEQLLSDDAPISQAMHQRERVVHGHGDVGAQLPQSRAKVCSPINLNPGHVTLTLWVNIWVPVNLKHGHVTLSLSSVYAGPSVHLCTKPDGRSVMYRQEELGSWFWWVGRVHPFTPWTCASVTGRIWDVLMCTVRRCVFFGRKVVFYRQEFNIWNVLFWYLV